MGELSMVRMGGDGKLHISNATVPAQSAYNIYTDGTAEWAAAIANGYIGLVQPGESATLYNNYHISLSSNGKIITLHNDSNYGTNYTSVYKSQ